MTGWAGGLSAQLERLARGKHSSAGQWQRQVLPDLSPQAVVDLWLSPALLWLYHLPQIRTQRWRPVAGIRPTEHKGAAGVAIPMHAHSGGHPL